MLAQKHEKETHKTKAQSECVYVEMEALASENFGGKKLTSALPSHFMETRMKRREIHDVSKTNHMIGIEFHHTLKSLTHYSLGMVILVWSIAPDEGLDTIRHFP